ncbi:hypothetical protein FZEAL_2134 [Fusarium zealandicum]|uniref:Uncharacterized protein n=1 Tax=Fusarium zealandicum TaxID=1053134 RepID=A0A8H4XP92_9HYPO|nr:hypothetical protein FZEAL_2134 [Fusarium zealandicum]
MASRRPNLTLPLPEREPFDLQRPQTSLRSPSIRSPRFREDFDAPFSEAIMNASRTTLATDTFSLPYASEISRTSFGGDSDRRTSFSAKQSTAPPPSPLRLRHTSWESETKRRARVNDRIMEWAKRSWTTVRSRSNSKTDYFDSRPAQSQSSVAVSSSSDEITPSESDDNVPVNSYTRAVITVIAVPQSRPGSS